ncbi:hypothetical protein [Phycicoccus duodecadis]|uniref:hypothetical protein n=1 Tax=Phycicoccus duodecadis TaxID=173053 RepID=UPI00117DB0AC|nr:hypothetical protein [Phycicoccus duodecadis]
MLSVGTRDRAAARLATDGTRWCGRCDTTLRADSREALCATCRRDRNTEIQQARRQQARAAARPVGLTVTSDTLERLLSANSTLQRKTSVASGVNRPTNGQEQPPWLDELLVAAKNVAIAVDAIERQIPRRR